MCRQYQARTVGDPVAAEYILAGPLLISHLKTDYQHVYCHFITCIFFNAFAKLKLLHHNVGRNKFIEDVWSVRCVCTLPLAWCFPYLHSVSESGLLITSFAVHERQKSRRARYPKVRTGCISCKLLIMFPIGSLLPFMRLVLLLIGPQASECGLRQHHGRMLIITENGTSNAMRRSPVVRDV